jgi:hypothetical protein
MGNSNSELELTPELTLFSKELELNSKKMEWSCMEFEYYYLELELELHIAGVAHLCWTSTFIAQQNSFLIGNNRNYPFEC